jgi:hypothetical protein
MLGRAYRRGANAVVGMRFDHRSISESWTEICAYGTAVFVTPAVDADRHPAGCPTCAAPAPLDRHPLPLPVRRPAPVEAPPARAAG